ncbi:cyclic pyranopterin monophosphate synthase accessory protein [Clostridia bacterium]|nr:cyclic pyranopterin monophosphate synthase accessory protein [Clostridia bacterium]
MNEKGRLTHWDEVGKPHVVCVGWNDAACRIATAKGRVVMKRETLGRITSEGINKGDVFDLARTAGVRAVKHTPVLIPMCHNVVIDGIDVDFFIDMEKNEVLIEAKVSARGNSGADIKALNAVSTAALMIYDLCKAFDNEIRISDIRLCPGEGKK